MAVSNWDEIRTAFHVARLGTVSGAAEALGVHHATVIRHIDALESALGVKLFQRHARGYTPTEAGLDLLQVAQTTDEQFTQLVGRIRGRGETVAGDLVVTSVSSAAHVFVPLLAEFQAENPGIRVRFLTSERLFRLEYGEAHVAIRAGAAPEQPDNVVQPFFEFCPALCASKGYVDRHGRPEGEGDLARHSFVSVDATSPAHRAPFARWLERAVPADRIVFRGSDERVVRDAVAAGAGLGFVTRSEQAALPDLVEVLPPRPDWAVRFWLVTHVDLHRTAKVQSVLTFLKDRLRAAGGTA
jgi:DNA-binding transcriptional LysR family regulator